MTCMTTRKIFLAAAISALTSLAVINGTAAQTSGGGNGGGGGSAGATSGGSHGGDGKIAKPQPIGTTAFPGAPGAPPTHGYPNRPRPVRILSARDPHCSYQQVGHGRGAIYLRYCGENQTR
ncbi:hypothetical protein C8N35_101246 [Breoghania corrubedonensis]|uniref:Uncharacterized protein n=1 Tax=Breoghania corrubedonensis TaxID=665038 RepID=A0A2T5VEM2_9HYPH|nr:hypothetical protein C8N35_101246 [Breoghania corrubedonensis]